MQRAAITLCHKNYFKDEPSLRDSFNGLQDKEAAEKFLRDHRDKLVDIMGKRFTSKHKSLEERNQQTIISRAHRSEVENPHEAVYSLQITPHSIPPLQNNLHLPVTGNAALVLVYLNDQMRQQIC